MATTQLEPKVLPGRTLRSLDLGIWSAMPDGFEGAPYNLKAMAVDAVETSGPFQRLVWGVSPDSYEAFANEAFSKENLPFLDAGCGTMRFTAPVYARVDLPLTAVDLSLGALRKAQDRMANLKIDSPNRTALVQADLMDLPFPDHYYETVLCMGVLHLFADGGRLLDSLVRMIQPGGELYLTSLVSVEQGAVARREQLTSNQELLANRDPAEIRQAIGDRFRAATPIGEKFGRLLLEKGEIGAWRTPAEVSQMINDRLNLVSFWTEGNAAFAWAVKPL